MDTERILAAVIGASAIATTIFHIAMHVGRLSVRVERLEKKVIDHDELFQEFKGV